MSQSLLLFLHTPNNGTPVWTARVHFEHSPPAQNGVTDRCSQLNVLFIVPIKNNTPVGQDICDHL